MAVMDATGDAVVAGLWRYPVKSLQGAAVDQIDLGAIGVEGDRQWGIVDVATGKVLSAKRWPALLEASATLDDDGDGVTVTLPDGAAWRSGDPATDQALSAWLDRDVRLDHADAAAGTPYELTMDPADDDSEPWDFATPPGSFADLAAVHLLTTASLAEITDRHPGGQWDVHRFRPTALVDTASGTGFVEDGWIGGQVRLGDAVVDVFMATPRCAMPGRAQPSRGVVRDLSIVRTVRDHHDNNLGVYGAVTVPGPVAVGDPVRRT
jgi:MOSC domain-containing protein